jgi:hypothetical protein
VLNFHNCWDAKGIIDHAQFWTGSSAGNDVQYTSGIAVFCFHLAEKYNNALDISNEFEC